MQYKDGTFHYGFTQEGKDAFLRFLENELKSEHVGRWITLITDVRKRSASKIQASVKGRTQTRQLLFQ